MNEIDQIKDLLFGHEKKALDAITRRLETPESRAADISDVLPESMRRSHERDNQLAGAMEAPVVESIRLAVRNNPQSIADSLFPVIGPAIRKAIAEALKGLVQSINQTLDTSLSPRLRYKAWRTGVPLAQIIMQRSLIYQVEQVFLIQRETGLLINHASDVPAAKDRDAVSAMFTAIQDFVKESFTQDASGALQSADMGEYTLWGFHGPAAMLVCLIRGTPPHSLRDRVNEVVERVHRYHSDLLTTFNGDSSTATVLVPDLTECLEMERRTGARSEHKAGFGLWLFLAILVAALVYLGVSQFLNARELAAYRDAILATPGVVALDVYREDGAVVVRGLQDPLAIVPLTEAVERGRLRLKTTPFQSLEPVIVQRRAYELLAPPDGVELTLDGSTLVVTGSVSAGFRNRVSALTPALAGISKVRIDAPPGDDEILRAAQAAAMPPELVRLTVNDAVLSAVGEAPQQWIQGLQEKVSNVDGLKRVELGDLVPIERAQLRKQAENIGRMQIQFAINDVFAPAQAVQLDALAQSVMAFEKTSQAVNISARIALVGHADGSDEGPINDTVRLNRARAVRQALVARGVNADILTVASGAPPVSNAVDKSLRRVSVVASALDANNRDWTT